MAVNFSLSKAGLEVYSTSSSKKQLPIADSTNANSTFMLQDGEVNRIDYIGELYSDSFESDYVDISSNASIVLPMDYYSLLFKGKKIALKKGAYETTLKWEDMETVVLGFITELSYSTDKINVKINGMDKLLDQEAKFTFKKMKISKIVEKIIKASGLKAKVDPKGLDDKIINFTNVSSNEDSNSSSSSSSVDTSTKLGKVVSDIIGNETDDYKKLQKLHKWGASNIKYSGYECSNHGCDPDECYKNRDHLNCGDTSVLMCAMYKLANLNAWIIHGDYHFWVIVEIGNKKYASDCTGNRSLNDVWSTSAHPNSPFKGSKANEKAICG